MSPYRNIGTSRHRGPSDLLICFSHLRWNLVYQRPQHLMTRAAATFQVLYLEEPIFRNVPEAFLESRLEDGVVVAAPIVPERLWGEDPAPVVRGLLRTWLAARGSVRRLVYWYYTPMALAFSDPADADLAVYDNMDELTLFKGAPAELIEFEDDLFLRADLIFCGGQSLYEAKRHRHRSIHAFPSSIDVDHFRAARGPIEEPADLAGLGRPRFGYFGVIDERLDIELLAHAAAARPDWQFVMIGPFAKIDESDLPVAPNIAWLGPKPYKDLPRYLAHFDVGIMPFAMNDATRFISPTKTPEFLAAGLPVVSTPIRDVVRPYGEQGLVRIAATPDAFVQACERTLEGAEPGWAASVQRHLRSGSWDRTWSSMRGLMAGLLDGRSRVAGVPGTLAAEGKLHV